MLVVVAFVVVALIVIKFAVVAKRLVKLAESAVNALVNSVVNAPILVVKFASVVDQEVINSLSKELAKY